MPICLQLFTNTTELRTQAAAAPVERKPSLKAIDARPPPCKPGLFTQFRVLIWREFVSIIRNPADIAGRMLVFCWLGLFVGLMFYDLSFSTEVGRGGWVVFRECRGWHVRVSDLIGKKFLAGCDEKRLIDSTGRLFEQLVAGTCVCACSAATSIHSASIYPAAFVLKQLYLFLLPPQDLRARLNLLYLQLIIFTLLPFLYMSLYTTDKQYFVADVSSRLYRPLAYYVAKTLAVLPFNIINVLVFTWTVYGLVGLNPALTSVFGNPVIAVLMYLIAAQVRLE